VVKQKWLFILVGMSMAAAGLGVFNYFTRFNRARNQLAPRPELIVVGSSSFIGPYGPGPELKTRFEKICLCDVRLVDGGGVELLLNKLSMANEVFDVVVGLDQIHLKRFANSVKWRALKVPDRNWLPVVKENYYRNFLPYDWSPMTFIFKKNSGLPAKGKIANFLDQLRSKSLMLQDPRLSTPGLQFVLWNWLLPDSFLRLSAKVKMLAPDWSAAYGLFRKGQALATFTYQTSIVYHWVEEKDESFQVAEFDEGHVAQIEFAAVPDLCRSCGLAERFVEFMTEGDSQRIIMSKNFMLPVVEEIKDNTEFLRLPALKLLTVENLDGFVDQQDDIIKQWRQTLSP